MTSTAGTPATTPAAAHRLALAPRPTSALVVVDAVGCAVLGLPEVDGPLR